MSALVPIVVGGVLTLAGGAGTEWLRDRRASIRSREDRQEVRQGRRDDLQRETMIDLQDAVQRYVSAVGAAVHFDEMTQRKHAVQTLLPDEMDAELHAAQVLVQKLATRVRDDDLRSWAREMVEEGTTAVLPHVEKPREHQKAMGRLYESIQERLGEHLRSL
jgi:hypothetical protein